MRDPIDPNEGPSAVIHGREDKPRTGSESLLLREADRSQVVEETHAYGGIEHKMPGPFADCLLCEVERLQRIVSGVKSKTALDVVAEKMAAEDHAKELARQLEQVKGLRDEVTVVMRFCDGYGNDFAESCPDAAMKFSILASRLDRALAPQE
jgi:hypothetical protein